MNRTLNKDIKAVSEDLAFQQKRLAELETEKYTKLVRRGMAMIHLPDTDVKIILPNDIASLLVDNASFVISSADGDAPTNSSGVLTPFDGQLHVSYFTGD